MTPAPKNPLKAMASSALEILTCRQLCSTSARYSTSIERYISGAGGSVGKNTRVPARSKTCGKLSRKSKGLCRRSPPYTRHRPVVAIVSAMQAEMGAAAGPVPIQIVHSENDDKVDIQSAKILRDSWRHCFDIDTRHSYKVTNGHAGSASWEHCRYRNGGGEICFRNTVPERAGSWLVWRQSGESQFSRCARHKTKYLEVFCITSVA